MVDFATLPSPPTQIEYLDAAAATAAGRRYKQRLLDALILRPGQAVLDLGCGPGTDLIRLAGAVGARGSVVGIDHDLVMIKQAGRRVAGHRNIDVRAGDAHSLPLKSASVDRARVDRVLQHVEDPPRALAELRRVIRPGGLLGMAEPDWDTLAIDDIDVETSRSFARFLAGRVRNCVIGRQLARLAVEAGFTSPTVEAISVVFRDYETAEQILGLQRSAARAVHDGALPEDAARSWLGRLMSGPFLACFTVFIVTAQS